MKDKLIDLKNKIVSFLINIKNKMVELFVANKIAFITILVSIGIILFIIFIRTSNSKIKNTSGNLNNLGFSVQSGNTIYYLGYKDGNVDGIYKIKTGGKNGEKILDDYACYINYSGNYLYYFDAEEKNVVKVKKNGKDREIIVEDVDTAKITVVDNWLYYFKNSSLYRVKTNGQNKQKISKKSIDNYEVVDNYIYYSYYNDGKYIIAKMKTNGEEVSKINSDAGEVFFVKDNNIYYMKEVYSEEQSTTIYELYKMNKSGKNVVKVATIQDEVDIDTLNFDEENIYYTKLDEDNNNGMYKMDLRGKKEMKITDIEEYSTFINIHEDWIYYPDENEDGNIEMYVIKTNGKGKHNI